RAQDAELCVINSDGSDLHVILTSPELTWPAWSPDGSQLAIEGANPRTGHASLFVVAPDGSNKTKLLAGHISAPGPVWDPSGTALALFLHDDIVLVPTDGSPVETVAKSISDPGYGSLAWQPSAP